MTTTKTALICNKFAGIRRIDARFSEDVITCSDCQNVELFNTGINSGVGIRNSKGNISLYDQLAENEQIYGTLHSNQNSTDYCIIYTEDGAEGKLYLYENFELTELIDGLSCTTHACGVDFTQGYNDLFMFTNGEDVVKVDLDAQTQAEILELTGTESEEVKGLGFKVYNSRLWIFDKTRLWYSYKGDCTDFSTVEPTYTTSAGYIEFSKNITAIYPYLGSLAVFHKDSSALVSNDTSDNFSVTDDSPGGCCGYDALVFHGTDLYFYDDTKKGVFSFQQIINGDKTLGQNIAIDLQEELLNIPTARLDEIHALSVVLSDRNEVWFKLPNSNGNTTILIFDAVHGEWVKRKEQPINCFGIINNKIYSGGAKLYEEYNGYDFDGEFIQSYYYVTPMNLGSDNTLKMLYFPPRLTVDTTASNNFWVRYIKNYDFFKREKKKHIIAKTLKNVLYYDKGMNYDSIYHYAPKNCTAIIKFPTNTFKTLEMRLYTEELNQGFCIRTIEFSKIKVKTA